jgi:hypothetical protein
MKFQILAIGCAVIFSISACDFGGAETELAPEEETSIEANSMEQELVLGVWDPHSNNINPNPGFFELDHTPTYEVVKTMEDFHKHKKMTYKSGVLAEDFFLNSAYWDSYKMKNLEFINKPELGELSPELNDPRRRNGL